VSTQGPDRDETTGQDEPFLSRWSRRKAQARRPEPVEPAQDAPAVDAPANVACPPADKTVPELPVDAPATPAAATPPPVELPNLDELGEDSDYSAFLTPGVDTDLRRRALRKLFSSPKFNVFDGLDTYRDDFTSFPALGSVVTADMRYHVERLAKKALEVLDEQTKPVEPAAPVAAIAASEADTPVAPGTPAREAAAPPALDEENHDSAS
jgi:hypothetical protein